MKKRMLSLESKKIPRKSDTETVKKNREKGISAEYLVARKYGLHRIKGSGSGRAKGDFTHPIYRIQHKLVCNSSQTFYLTEKLLLKVISDTVADRLPALIVSFKTDELAFIPCTERGRNIVYLNKNRKIIDKTNLNMYYRISHKEFPLWKSITVYEMLKD